MNWFCSIAFLGTACSAALVEEVISSESSYFPDLEVLESVFKRSFENASYTETLDGGRARAKGDMPQEKLSYLQHGQHPGNEEVWKLHLVWKAMNNVARQLPQIVSANIEPKTMSMIRNLCERHARDDIGLRMDEIDCTARDYPEYRSIDGTCNNLINTRWGSAAQPFERFLPADYGQGCVGGVIIAGQCLLFSTETLSWNAAKEKCSSEYGTLASLNDPGAFSDYVHSKYGNTVFWLGGSDTSNEGSWVWQSGQPLGNQFPWRQGEPNDHGDGEDCLAKWDDGNSFNDVSCALQYKYVCEKGISGLRLTKENSQLPNPRKISRALSDSEPRETPQVSLMLMQWGQFLDHDITLTPEVELENEHDGSKALMCCDEGRLSNSESLWDDCVPIDVTVDPFYRMDGRNCIRFIRSMPALSGCAHTPREQINAITAFVDGSMVYGSDKDTADFLRTKSLGLLKTTTHGNGQPLPPNGSNQTETGTCPQRESMGSCFLAGDVRVDEIPSLTALHTTFIRLHNIIAQDLAKLKPYRNIYNLETHDEKLYQETRRIVGALIQQITYRDWLPHVVGPTLMEELHLKPEEDGYKDTYDPEVNPNIRNVFATAAFRFGHSLVAELLKPAASATSDLPLPGHFFTIDVIESDDRSPSSLLKGLTRCPAQPMDPVVVRALTDSLYTTEEDEADDGNFYGLDLVSLNIQRGRDHGIPSYREWRNFCNLPDITKFEDLKDFMPVELVDIFNQTYRDIDDIDLFPAGLAENKIADGILGPTFSCIIAQQFAKTKQGDRYWFEREDQPIGFTPEQLDSIRSQGLSSILCRVSEHTSFGFQPDSFLNEDQPGNAVKECSSYNFIDLQPWEDSCMSVGGTRVGGQCLFFEDDVQSWEDSVKSCEAKGMQLASITAPTALNAHLKSDYDGITFWLGGSDSANEGHWVWLNGRPFDGFPWENNEPNNYLNNQNCLSWGWKNDFDDGTCTNKYRYICAEKGACPNTFEELGHTCYKFYDLRMNWGDAKDACQELGQKLGEKIDLAELGSNPASGNDILLMQTIAEKGQTVWIGGTDAASEGTWKWSTSGRPLSLSNPLWWYHEPNNDDGSQDCLYVHMAGTHDRPTFFDGGCSHEFSFVCQVFNQ